MTQENLSLETESNSLISSDSDLFLMSLVEFVNQASLEMSITLFVQGTIIRGMLISEESYFKGLTTQLNSTNIAPADIVEKFTSSFISNTNLSDIQTDNQPINREFIHLKNVQINSGVSSISVHDEVYWRGRLSRIDGFLLAN